MVEGVFSNADLQITKQRRKQFYVIDDYKNPDGSVKRSRLHIKSVVVVSVLDPVPVNLTSTASLLAETTTTIVPANPSTLVSLLIILLLLTLHMFQQPPLLLSPLHLFQQPLLSQPIVLLFFSYTLTNYYHYRPFRSS